IYLGEAILKWFEKIIQYFKKNPKEDISTDENPQNIKDSPSPDTNSSSSDKDPSNSTTNVTGSNTNSQDKSQTSTKNSAHQDNNLDAISSTSDSSYTDGSSSNTDPSSSTTNVTGSDTDLQNKAQTPAKNNLPSAKTVPSNPQNTIYIEPKYKNTAPVRFFLEKNGMKIVECGGGGDCLIYSIMRQIKPYSEMSTKDFEDRRHQGMLEYRAQLTNLVLGNHPNNTNDIYSVLISDLTTLKNNLAEVRETSASENEELIQQIDNLTLYINRFTTNQNDAEARNNLTEQLGNFYAYISDLNEKNQKQNDLIQSVATCRLSISESALSDIGQYESNLLAREISTPGCSINLSAAGTSGICVGSTLVRITSRQLVVFTDTPSSTLKQNSKSAIIARIIGHNNQDETRYILYPDDLNNLPKDAIYLYYSGNTEYGHYQAIFPKEKNFSN
ncbi:MAG: hypothetical protein K2L13_00905, partial [Opitutales bacterium]|nr:hypothetical protein [Opitutales bacterium]